MNPRSNWTSEEVRSLYQMPFLELVYQAATVHRKFHDPAEVQLCTLLSVKTGGCPENCHYCPQSAHHESAVERKPLMGVDDVLSHARRAKEEGSTRFCMGAAWREVKDNSEFDRILEMVRGVKALDIEVCCTLGMLTAEQARRLKEAGLDAYNHNLDTSEKHYSEIIQTRTYQDRLRTLKNVSDSGISVCCGGILGLGETEDDRVEFLHSLCTLSPHPESVPINTLVPVEGTPLEDAHSVPALEWIRVIACARILMPTSKVRLSAGRLSLSPEVQAFAFLAGANSIFTGEKLLTTPNPERDFDLTLLNRLGLRAMEGVTVGTSHARA